MTEERLAELGPAVVGYADALSRRLGWADGEMPAGRRNGRRPAQTSTTT
jgi:hypothetical protein